MNKRNYKSELINPTVSEEVLWENSELSMFAGIGRFREEEEDELWLFFSNGDIVKGSDVIEAVANNPDDRSGYFIFKYKDKFYRFNAFLIACECLYHYKERDIIIEVEMKKYKEVPLNWNNNTEIAHLKYSCCKKLVKRVKTNGNITYTVSGLHTISFLKPYRGQKDVAPRDRKRFRFRTIKPWYETVTITGDKKAVYISTNDNCIRKYCYMPPTVHWSYSWSAEATIKVEEDIRKSNPSLKTEHNFPPGVGYEKWSLESTLQALIIQNQFPYLPDNAYKESSYWNKKFLLKVKKLGLDDIFMIAYTINPNLPRTKKMKDLIRRDYLNAINNLYEFQKVGITNVDYLYKLEEVAKRRQIHFTANDKKFIKDFMSVNSEKKLIDLLYKAIVSRDNVYVFPDTANMYEQVKKAKPDMLVINGKSILKMKTLIEMHDKLAEITRVLEMQNKEYDIPDKIVQLEGTYDDCDIVLARNTIDLVKIASACKNCVVSHERKILNKKEVIFCIRKQDNILACISLQRNKLCITEAKSRLNYPLTDEEFDVVEKWMKDKKLSSDTKDTTADRTVAFFAGENYNHYAVNADGEIVVA